MQPTKRRLLLTSEQIASRIKEMGAEISARFPDGNLLIIGVLKGSFMFLADLVRSLTVPCRIEFVRIASYGSGTVSSGELRILLDVGLPLEDWHVILVDDIVDTGLTLSEYSAELRSRSPLSLSIAACIDKTARRDKHVHLDYCGFRLEDGFIVGYGLDCDEQYRQLPDLYVLE